MIYYDNDSHWLIKKLKKDGFTNIELIVPQRGRGNRWNNQWGFTCDEINRDIDLGFTRKDVLIRYDRIIKEIKQEVNK